ncbi:cytochrome b, partial [Camelimonas abortus]
MTTAAPTRYDGVAIALHWLGAACIIALLATGFWMTSAIARPDSQALAYRVFQLHKSLGFLALALAVVRLQWRLAHPLPPPPAGMRAWERFAAGAAHAAFYALLLLLPLTGWLLVSAGWATASDAPLAVPTRWFGLFTVPHLPGVADAAPATRRALAFGSGAAHAALAWTMLTLLALHVAAALKHQFIARDGALARMIPGLAPAGAGQPGTGRRRPAETLAGAGFVTA